MPPKTEEKSRASPTQPLPPIEDLFATLNGHIKDSEFEKAIKVADHVLSVAPGDEDAICCKVAAFIKEDRIEAALSVIQSSKKPISDLSYFKVFLVKWRQLDACVDEYCKIQKSKIESVEINFVAALVSSGRASEVQGALEALRVKATSNYELAYNTACSLIERKSYNDAEQLLSTSIRIGQESLTKDNFTKEEIEIELAPIVVQLAYVKQLLGQTQEAVGDYANIINRNVADEPSLAVAVNNLVSAKGPKDVLDSLWKLDKIKDKDVPNFQLTGILDSKLSPKQKEVIYANRVLLLIHAREMVAKLLDYFPNSLMPVLLQAAVFVRENKAGKDEEILGQFAEKFPDKSKFVLLARAQVAAAANHPQIAADSLTKIPDIQHMPATVATVVALKERAGDITGAAAVLDAAVKWWLNAMTEDNKLSRIMQEAASFKLRHGQEEDASRLYEELVKNHGSIEALVGLVTTVAHVDVNKAETYENKLKPLPGLKAVDVDSLEKTSGAKHIEGASQLGVTEAQEEGKKEKSKKKRKQKPRYPKGFDSANPGPPPDPERWLPRRERSSYRPSERTRELLRSEDLKA